MTSSTSDTTTNWLDQDFSHTAATCQSRMLTASFNQDGGCLSIGTKEGFELFNLAPFQSSVSRQNLGKSLAHVEMLFRCNILALVGGGDDNPYAPSHRVLIWDDHLQKAIGELSFRQVVLRVQLRRDAIAVALRDRIYIYTLSDLSLRDKIYTTDNPHGLLCLSTAVQDMVLCCPSVTDGHVRVELYGLRKTVLLEAHESSLRALALTEDGTHLATASIKGTVLRVFDVAKQTCLAEFRRGVERVTMTCLRWSWDHRYLACCSEKGTTHVFRVFLPADTNGTTTDSNHHQSKKQTKTPSSWYDKVRKKVGVSAGDVLRGSVAQIRGVARPLACAFVPDLPNTLAVVGWDLEGNGVLLLSDFSSDENEPIRTAYHVISKANADDDFVLDEGKRRRKRLMAQTTSTPSTNHGSSGEEGKLYVGERLEVLENQMKEIRFEEEDEGFLNIDVDDNKKKNDKNNTRTKPLTTEHPPTETKLAAAAGNDDDDDNDEGFDDAQAEEEEEENANQSQ